MLKRLLKHVEPAVFLVSGGMIALFLLFGALFTDTAETLFGTTQSFIVDVFGWFYILIASVFVIFVLWLLLSRYAKIRLGGDDAKPEFSYGSWFAMLFSAGMGIGLVYYGVAEPMTHYLNPPIATPESAAAVTEAFRFTFFHWGLHPWAIYIVLGLSLAYFHFRYDLPLTPRSIFYPLLGKRIYGPAGHAIDTLAVIATLFGLATSLGLGVMQINTGLGQIAGVAQGTWIQVLLIAIITGVATMSVVSGLDGGIKRISQFNVLLAVILMVFVLIVGPTIYILNTFVGNVGNYVQNLAFLSFWTGAGTDGGFQSGWTLFYWGWWISWAPFVGIFIARISKGRTIREFILGVLFVPTIVTFLWLSVFGGTGLFMERNGIAGIAAANNESATLSLYAVLGALPLGTILAVLFTILVASFFITSSDSGSLVIDMITSGGNPNPPVAQRVFWALTEGAVAAVLLLTGGLGALQTAAITSGLPMAILMVFMCFSLVKALRIDIATGERVPTLDELSAKGGSARRQGGGRGQPQGTGD